MSNFGIFYDARSPNMAMSHDPRSKFRVHYMLGKAAKFVAEKLCTSKLSAKSLTGGRGVENTPPSAFRVNSYVSSRDSLIEDSPVYRELFSNHSQQTESLKAGSRNPFFGSDFY